MFSKDELYTYKANPKRLTILSDKLPLERKRTYSFFIGSNFQVDASKATFFRLNEHPLVSIDTSMGILQLSILASVNNGKVTYLIKDNELMIESQDVWDMHYSRSSLIIWKIISGKKTVFINLIFKPDVIIIKRMDTIFNGKRFRVYKRRKPQQHQIDKIKVKVTEFEGCYYILAKEIDSQPPKYEGTHNGVDINQIMKQFSKDRIKTEFERYLYHEYCKQFRWSWTYYISILEQELRKSPVFKRNKNAPDSLPAEFRQLHEKKSEIKKKYCKEFDELKDTVVEYNTIEISNAFMC